MLLLLSCVCLFLLSFSSCSLVTFVVFLFVVVVIVSVIVAFVVVVFIVRVVIVVIVAVIVVVVLFVADRADLRFFFFLAQWFKCDDAWITKASLDDVLHSEG